MENANNFIIDHCSFSWASEENTDFIDTHFSTYNGVFLVKDFIIQLIRKVPVLMEVHGEELHLLTIIIYLLTVIAVLR